MSKEKWIEKAKQLVGFGGGKKPRTNIEMNRLITKQYARMYCKNPKVFKWAGMAAYASQLVGKGIRQGIALGQSGLPWIPGVSDISGVRLAGILSAGNLLVYADIFWQHLAYCEGGLAALEKCFQAKEIPERVIKAWRKIDAGAKKNDPDKIWEGNKELLKYEQEVTLQKGIYDFFRSFFTKVSSRSNLANKFGLPLLESPIPGDKSTIHDISKDADIGKFEDRWKWIKKYMLPAYRKLETNHPENVKGMMKALSLAHRPDPPNRKRYFCSLQLDGVHIEAQGIGDDWRFTFVTLADDYLISEIALQGRKGAHELGTSLASFEVEANGDEIIQVPLGISILEIDPRYNDTGEGGGVIAIQPSRGAGSAIVSGSAQAVRADTGAASFQFQLSWKAEVAPELSF